jgi:hypothetical protein
MALSGQRKEEHGKYDDNMTNTRTIDLTFNISELIGGAITKACLLIQSRYRFFYLFFHYLEFYVIENFPL